MAEELEEHHGGSESEGETETETEKEKKKKIPTVGDIRA